FSRRRRHTRFSRDWSSDVCSSDLGPSILLLRQLLSQIHSHRLLTLPSHRLLSRYRLVVAENPQAKAPVLFQVLLLLRIVRLELKIGRASCRERGVITMRHFGLMTA